MCGATASMRSMPVRETWSRTSLVRDYWYSKDAESVKSPTSKKRPARHGESGTSSARTDNGRLDPQVLRTFMIVMTGLVWASTFELTHIEP